MWRFDFSPNSPNPLLLSPSWWTYSILSTSMATTPRVLSIFEGGKPLRVPWNDWILRTGSSGTPFFLFSLCKREFICCAHIKLKSLNKTWCCLIYFTQYVGKKKQKKKTKNSNRLGGNLSFVAASLSAYHFIQNQNIYSWKKNLFYQQLYLRTLYAHGLSFCLKICSSPAQWFLFYLFKKRKYLKCNFSGLLPSFCFLNSPKSKLLFECSLFFFLICCESRERRIQMKR